LVEAEASNITPHEEEETIEEDTEGISREEVTEEGEEEMEAEEALVGEVEVEAEVLMIKTPNLTKTRLSSEEVEVESLVEEVAGVAEEEDLISSQTST